MIGSTLNQKEMFIDVVFDLGRLNVQSVTIFNDDDIFIQSPKLDNVSKICVHNNNNNKVYSLNGHKIKMMLFSSLIVCV